MTSNVDNENDSTSKMTKIESLLKDMAYRQTIEYSANFNTRLCSEKRLRMPFVDLQTGVAQNPSQLFVSRRQRMPGFRMGQIYTYPSLRWRKGKKQSNTNDLYHRFPERPFETVNKDQQGRGVCGTLVDYSAASTIMLGLSNHSDFSGVLLEGESSSLGASFGGDTSDSKDSHNQGKRRKRQHQHHQAKTGTSTDWFYDDLDANDDSFEDSKSSADDEYDYDPRYGSKKRRKRKYKKKSSKTGTEPHLHRPYATSTPFRNMGAVTEKANFLSDINCNPTAKPNKHSTSKTCMPATKRTGHGVRGRRRTKNLLPSACDTSSPNSNSKDAPDYELASNNV